MKNLSNRAVDSQSHLKAVLGPTNTGKTHLAVERMLGHASGMIGLPLRLLAREIYDRVVAIKGKNFVALITGEEKIVPAHARWWICTVESMPIDKQVDFLAVDEIQLAADFDRGHVFTDRLLRARGQQETMLLGSETMRPLIARFLPDAEYTTRPRFSELTYVVPRKISRLPRRSALVTFSARNVYGFAEMLRRQKGGAAVVMGSLSPRTRNAQVEMYQNGDVDYLVATDAIGMGLNMDIDHVTFADTAKFDGRQMRDLTSAEMAQIAGRAGRYMQNGTFGCLTEGAGDQRDLSDAYVHAIENHEFPPNIVLQWRNSYLDYAHPDALIRSLETAPERKGLSRTLENTDLLTLRKLIATTDIRARLLGPAANKTLWECCQIPDFRKVSDEVHTKLCGDIFRQISGDQGAISHDWIAQQVAPLNRMDGDMDSLATRIAHIRTWTYISHREQWLDQAEHWQHTTRDIEDRLSDALHQRLMQKFVDRRMSVLMRELRQKGRLMADIDSDGSIFVESHFIGTLEGFQFREDPAAFGEDSKILRHAADKVLAEEISARTTALCEAEDGEISLIFGDPLTSTTLNWRGIPVARVTKGAELLAPKVVMIPSPLLQGENYTLVLGRLERWLRNHVEEILSPLFALKESVNGAKDTEGKERISGLARGIAFQMLEKLGTIPRRLVAKDFRTVDKDGRFQLKQHGIWIGAASLYIPSLLKPAPAQLRLLLWALNNEQDHLPGLPPAGLCTIKIDEKAPRAFYEVSGYRVTGKNAVRLDMLERLANAAREVSLKGPFPADADLMSLVGVSGDDFMEIMGYLGYVQKEYSAEEAAKIALKHEQAAALKDKKTEETADPEDKKTEGKAPDEKNTEEKTVEEKVVEEKVAEEKAVEEKAAAPEDTEDKTPPEENTPPEKVMLFIHQPDSFRNSARRPANHKARKGAPKNKGPKDNRAKTAPTRKARPLDPDSPFAALAGLKRSMARKK